MLIMGTPGGPNWKTLEALGDYAAEVNSAVNGFSGSIDDFLLLADMLGMKGLDQFPSTGLSHMLIKFIAKARKTTNLQPALPILERALNAWNDAEALTVSVAQHTGDPYFPSFEVTTAAVQDHLNGNSACVRDSFDKLLRRECAIMGRALIDLDNLDLDVDVEDAAEVEEDASALVYEDMLLFRSKRRA
ncbi:MAG: hypothetical protein AAGD04_00305 [Pseudomonadota bacterium]